MATTLNRLAMLTLFALLAAAAALFFSAPAHAAVADIKVTKTASDTSVSDGDKFIWRVRITNQGQTPANNVRLVDTLPESVRLLNVLSGQGGPCKVDFPKVVCNVGALSDGSQALIRFRVRAEQPGTLRNKAKVSTTTRETNKGNNKAVSVVRAS